MTCTHTRWRDQLAIPIFAARNAGSSLKHVADYHAASDLLSLRLASQSTALKNAKPTRSAMFILDPCTPHGVLYVKSSCSPSGYRDRDWGVVWTWYLAFLGRRRLGHLQIMAVGSWLGAQSRCCCYRVWKRNSVVCFREDDMESRIRRNSRVSLDPSSSTWEFCLEL